MKALAIALLVGCGGPSTPTTTTPTTPEAPKADFPTGPPLLTPGERMTYRVQLGGIELAAMTLVVGTEQTDVGGKKTLVVQGHAKSVGLANMVTAIDDTFTSWIDVGTGRSLRFAVDEFETNSKTNVEHTVAEIAQTANNQIPISFAFNKDAPTPEPQTLAYPDPWDYNAFLVALRAWEAPAGTSKKLECLRSRWLWHIDVTVGKKEQLATELGDLPALRFDAVTFKVDRKGVRVADSEERKFSVWISDDDGRVPLLVSAKTDWGDVKMEIVDYQPGTGERLR